MTKEVMKQALDVLQGCLEHPDTADVISALVWALAQPVQPERKLVWLTREDVELWELPSLPTVYEFTQFIEAKLKEKNK